ncbi:MAG: DUF4230 domain-containing protein [Acidobacteria bacterium]|nr:DUF4230 domain-containing protein [Acidobacteriota bacterium]
MKRLPLLLTLVLGILVAGYLLIRLVMPAGSAGVPTVSSSVDFIRQIGELHVLRASVKEIVTSKIGEATWIKTPGKLAVICHFDIKYKYNLHNARIVAGSREDGTRYCMIHLPKHEFEISTKEIRFYDEQDGTWLGFTMKTPPDEKTRALEAARVQAESQAKAFLGDMEGEIQASAKATLTQIAKAFGYSDISIEFEK